MVTIENETTARLEWAYEIEPDAFSIAVLSEDGSITDVGEAGGDERVASVEYEACGGVFLYRVTALSDGREYPVAKSGPVDVCDMIRIPEGTAWVGCDPAVDAFCRDDEMPVHEAWITQFWMDRTEVSFEKYAECSLAGTCVATALAPSDVGAADDAPVLGVNWSMARDYCIGRGKRLPTEAEWEKAGRGTTARVYPWGNDWNPGYANWDDDGLYDGFDSPS
ncbi:MAG: formylglycine-generating enzyme family protein, partial [Deltaproteobacteria bacterium]|nr:formylglycine-generating enzyme family protein [Deltaproteobacteria bacterium]